MTTATTPIRDGSRNATAIGSGRTCLVCTRPPANARARYCSPAHRQLAFRLRHAQLTRVDDTALRAELRQRGALVAHTVYECGQCGEQLIGERRCPECNVFCRAVGLGGRCNQCEQPVLLADLLELELEVNQ
jgi:rubrerythrin